MKAKTRLSPTPSSPASAQPNPAPNHGEIATLAAALWRQRGCPSGVDDTIWLDAERQLGPVSASWRVKRDMKALSNPLSRLNLKSGGVMGELEDLFPKNTGRSTTSL